VGGERLGRGRQVRAQLASRRHPHNVRACSAPVTQTPVTHDVFQFKRKGCFEAAKRGDLAVANHTIYTSFAPCFQTIHDNLISNDTRYEIVSNKRFSVIRPLRRHSVLVK
jgi:hypothetical protein